LTCHAFVLPARDPYLTGEYAEWFTKGMQSAPEDPSHIQASACCKHYVVNSMEHTKQKDGEEHDRQHVDSLVTKQDLVDSYMYPFQACVEKGQVSGLMCSYVCVPALHARVRWPLCIHRVRQR
jgi:beta-D-xylosidase 4